MTQLKIYADQIGIAKGNTMSNSEDKQLKLIEKLMFCTGTEHYYTNKNLAFEYTDGVKIFCNIAEAYWLLDIVNSVIKTKPEMNNGLINIILQVKKDRTAKITFRERVKFIYEQKIPFTDCPCGVWKFYFRDGVFFWNREY